MPRRDGQLVALLVILAAIAAAPFVWRALRPETAPPPDPRIDLNAATEAEIAAIPGIGPARAEAIVRLRAARGRLRAVDDLRDVPGLDAGTIERMRRFVRTE